MTRALHENIHVGRNLRLNWAMSCWKISWLGSLGVGQNLRPLERSVTYGSVRTMSDRLTTVLASGDLTVEGTVVGLLLWKRLK